MIQERIYNLHLKKAPEAQRGKEPCLKPHSPEGAACRSSSPSSVSGAWRPLGSARVGRAWGFRILVSQQAAAGGWAQLPPEFSASPTAASGGSSGHVFPLSVKLGANSRKTCEVANGIMEKVFIYFSKAAYEDVGRPRRQGVSRLVTGISRHRGLRGSGAAAGVGVGVWAGALSVSAPARATSG